MIRMSAGEYRKIKGTKPPPSAKDRPQYSKYTPRRVDKNQPATVETFRRLGFTVESLHEVGKGMFDLIVAKHGLNVLVEVKNGLNVPSARELTPAQERFHFYWTGMRCVVTCGADCLRLSDQITAIAYRLRECGIVLHVYGSREPMYQPKLF